MQVTPFQQNKIMLFLLKEILPYLKDIFVLKGGSAINCFYQGSPRYSIDIDITFILKTNFDDTKRIMRDVLQKIGSMFASDPYFMDTKYAALGCKLIIDIDKISYKIEPNLVLRETIFPHSEMYLNPITSSHFEIDPFKVLCQSKAEIYAGKICAALDRQLCRDFFDVKILLESDGHINNDIKNCLLYNLIGSKKAMHVLLLPNKKNLEYSFPNIDMKSEMGMSRIPISLEEIEDIRSDLFANVPKMLTDKDKQFLLSFQGLNPDWSLTELPSHVQEMPAMRW